MFQVHIDIDIQFEDLKPPIYNEDKKGRIKTTNIYDRGVFAGYFTTFNVNEDVEHPYAFQIDWEFKIIETKYTLPINQDLTGTNAFNAGRKW